MNISNNSKSFSVFEVIKYLSVIFISIQAVVCVSAPNCILPPSPPSLTFPSSRLHLAVYLLVFFLSCGVLQVLISDSVSASAAATPGSAPLPQPCHPRPANTPSSRPSAPPASRGQYCQPAGSVLCPESPTATQR